MNGCRHEQEDRKCHHPDVVKEEGYIDWCAEGPGCPRQEPDTDRIEEIKARCEAATNEDNPSMETSCFLVVEDIPFMLGEIERLTKERDAAIAEMRGKCKYCKNAKPFELNPDSQTLRFCEYLKDALASTGRPGCEHWEWRGVQK